MSIKHGAVLHSANGFLIHRAQRAGASNLGLNETQIKELGNWQTVATTRDVPDLSVDIESFDTTTRFEAIITGADPDAMTAGQEFDLTDAKPIDIVSPYKPKNQFLAVRGVAYTYMTLGSATYRFGIEQSATQAFTVQGDAVYFIPGSPRYEEFAAAGVGPYNFADASLVTVEDGDNVFAYCVTLVEADGTYTRLFHGDDYTDTANGFTLIEAAPVGSTLKAVSGTAVQDPYPQTIHADTTVIPAEVKGRNIDVYISDGAATPTLVRIGGVQNAEVTWQVTLEQEKEFGNPHAVAVDYDTPTVSGSIGVRPNTPEDMFDLIAQITGVDPAQTINVLSAVPLEMEIRISHPDTGDVIKTFYIPDARFTPPAPQPQVDSKLELTFQWSSDTGQLLIYNGERP